MTRHEIKIEGMSCSGCVSAVENVLKQNDKIYEVQVSLEEGLARIDSDIDISDISNLIKQAGYEPKLN